MFCQKCLIAFLCAVFTCMTAVGQEKPEKEHLEYAHQSASRYIFSDNQAVFLIHPRKLLEGSIGTRLSPVFDGYLKSFLRHVTDQDVDPTELETMAVYLMAFTPEQAAERMTPEHQTKKYEHPKFHSVFLQFATNEASERFFAKSKEGKSWKKVSFKDTWVSGSKDNRFLMHPTGKLRSYVVATQWKFQKMIAKKDVNSELQEMVRSIKDPQNDFGFIQLNDQTRKNLDPAFSLIGDGSEHILAANKLSKAINFRLFGKTDIYVQWIGADEADNPKIAEHIRQFTQTALANLNIDPTSEIDSNSATTRALRLYQHFLINVSQPKATNSRRPHILRYRVPTNMETVTASPKEKLDPEHYEETAEPELYKSLDRMKILNTATRIWLAKHKTLPDNSPIAGSKYPVSWRVKLLPYIEAGELYKQYRTDQPWDSEHNKKLLQQMPLVFGDSESKSKLLRLVGDTIFGDGQQAINPLKSPTGSPWNHETIFLLAVDQDKAIPWTKPEDLEIDASDGDFLKILDQLGDINKRESIAFLQFDHEEAYWPKHFRRKTARSRAQVKMLLGK